MFINKKWEINIRYDEPRQCKIYELPSNEYKLTKEDDISWVISTWEEENVIIKKVY